MVPTGPCGGFPCGGAHGVNVLHLHATFEQVWDAAVRENRMVTKEEGAMRRRMGVMVGTGTTAYIAVRVRRLPACLRTPRAHLRCASPAPFLLRHAHLPCGALPPFLFSKQAG